LHSREVIQFIESKLNFFIEVEGPVYQGRHLLAKLVGDTVIKLLAVDLAIMVSNSLHQFQELVTQAPVVAPNVV
jgi:hypothetical protein